jgi:hypothetical protein
VTPHRRGPSSTAGDHRPLRHPSHPPLWLVPWPAPLAWRRRGTRLRRCVPRTSAPACGLQNPTHRRPPDAQLAGDGTLTQALSTQLADRRSMSVCWSWVETRAYRPTRRGSPMLVSLAKHPVGGKPPQPGWCRLFYSHQHLWPIPVVFGQSRYRKFSGISSCEAELGIADTFIERGAHWA